MYLSSQIGESGIEAHVVAASVANSTELWTIETRAPKLIDAECITGDTLLHFERQANPDQQCLATMTARDFFTKWDQGIAVNVRTKRFRINLDLLELSKRYTFAELSIALGKYLDFVGVLNRSYADFPAQDCTISGQEFFDWYNTNTDHISYRDYKTTLSRMRLRTYDFSSGLKQLTHVIDVWETGVKKIVRVTAGKNSIRTSIEHLFLTQDGWKKAGNLDPQTDAVMCISHVGKPDILKNYLSFNRAIKKTVLTEQNHTCADCKCVIDVTCDIHHVETVVDVPEKAFERDNVVALCSKCHTKRHVDLGRSSLHPRFYKIVSVVEDGEEMTYDLQVAHKDQNFVANGFVVHNCEKHRMLSSNSSSSRAIPFTKTAKNADFYPTDVRANQKGMQGDKNVPANVEVAFLTDLARLREVAVSTLSMYQDTVHKQHVNWYLEPWNWQKKVITGTEWNNFFTLRLAPDTRPEFQELARCMKAAMDEVRENGKLRVLSAGEWHLPYVMDSGPNKLVEARLCSAARCARVSYMTHDNAAPSVAKDLELSSMLLDSRHLTPFEHQASPMRLHMNDCTWDEGVTHRDRRGTYWSANFKNWIQYRQLAA